jgi:hypothetical protein
MDTSDVRQWFDGYLDAFAACGRGERDAASLLAYYGVPLLLTSDDGVFGLISDKQVVAAIQRQADAMRTTGYHHSEVLDFEVTVLNATSALCRGSFSRQRGDTSELGRLAATYLVTDGPAGRRISALTVHSP